ncbi:hypothetical protein GCM10011396_38650 [Undibacterium terreum]|uniref:RHS repeat-associated core domain-containing protein n=2 Tax=Undibacterium terreum TaxID=1224302 RepID=A0A916UTN6_9BURK|nr:hypothetical protein GCM10011396_38650 [Undibacterium terreum]
MTVDGTTTPDIGFTGHVNDVDTGLTYMQQRYYDPIAGRFLSEDPALADANTGGGFSRYLYALNNPYRYIDPDGRESKCSPAMGVSCESSVNSTGSNGRSSNLKGEKGVNMRLEEINSIKGSQVLARNVTIVTESGVRFQVDIVWKDPLGAYNFEEIKFGPSSKLTAPQRAGLAEFTAGKWTVAGERAIEAGLKVGEPMGGIPRTRFGGWSLRGFGGADTNKMWEKVRKAWSEGGKYQNTD